MNRRQFLKTVLSSIFASIFLGIKYDPIYPVNLSTNILDKPYKTYFPFVSNHKEIYFGLGIANPPLTDLDLLGVDWFLQWTCNPSLVNGYNGKEYVALCYNTLDKKMGSDYNGYMLVFNEPDIFNQANMTVEEAIIEYDKIREYYSNAKLIVGNVSIFSTDWIRRFNDQRKLDTMGLHCYAHLTPGSTLDYINKELDKIYKDLEIPIWITEYNTIKNDPNEFGQLTKLLIEKKYIKRIAPFTNRQYGEWWNLPYSDLVENNQLTEKGQIYYDIIHK